MKYILDTNVISELRKKVKNQGVMDFISSVDQSNLYYSCITLGELRAVALKKSKTDPVVGKSIMNWIENITQECSERIVYIDLETCKKWAEFLVIDRTNVIDSLLAAQAASMDMVLVTRNIKHCEMFDVNHLNPFS